MRIGVKVGSANFADGGGVNKIFIRKLMKQLVELLNQGHQVFLVSSGAVVSDFHDKRSDELRAAVGQPRLMSYFSRELENYWNPPRELAQLLLLKDDLMVKDCQDHIKKVVEEAFEAGVLPVFNANDPVDSDELRRLERFEDNDNLFEAVCLMLQPEIAIFVTDVGGVMDDNGNVIHDPRLISQMAELFDICGSGEAKTIGFGTGGMRSKMRAAMKMAASGIETIIVDGKAGAFLTLAVGQVLCGQSLGYKFGTVVSSRAAKATLPK